MNAMVRALVGVVLVTGFNGGVCADKNAVVHAETELARLRSDIAALVGPARCVNLVNCRIAALGLNACGGAADYIAYSWLSTDKSALETRIAEYNFALEDAQKREAPVSACTALPEPVRSCINGRCVIRAGR